MEKKKWGKKKCRIFILKRNTAPGNLVLNPRFKVKEMRRLKKGLIQNRIKDGVPSESNPT